MYYRRKGMLALLQVFGGRLGKIDLQKLLFLVCQKQAEPEYDFIPYHYGCFSHSAKADLYALAGKGVVKEEEHAYSLKEKTNYLGLLTEVDKRLVNQVYLLYKKYDSDALMRHTYIHFPYYAIHSQSAARLLTPERLAEVENVRPIDAEPVLFTIGYEGVSLEA